jgi:hypothetical protein
MEDIEMENNELGDEDTAFHREYFRRRVVRLKRRPTSRCAGAQKNLSPTGVMAASCARLESISKLQAVQTNGLSQAFRIRVKDFCLRHGVTIIGATMWATAVTFALVLIRQELHIIFSGSL